MKIRVLGCHGSEQLGVEKSGLHQCRTCGFLINDTVMVDAGTIGTVLTFEEQRAVRHILLSHLHFDHIQGLPTFGDNLSEHASRPVSLISIAEVLDGLQTHIFNDTVYPNFLKLPTPLQPVFECRVVEPGHSIQVAGLQVTAIRVNHLVPAVGFLIREGASSMLYSGDTYATEEIWKMAAREATLKAAFIETSFPNHMAELALASKHLTPALLEQELLKLGRPDVPVYLYHMKPRQRGEIERDVRQLRLKDVSFLNEGQEIII
ncbi:3',5'-cyclic-nucleotide phosphodiesterase [Nitrospira sp. Nam74]